MKDLLLITPPFTQLNTPYPATAYLKGFLNTKNISAFQMDLGIEVILELFSKKTLQDVFSLALKTNTIQSENAQRIYALKDSYLKPLEDVIAFYNQGGEPNELLSPLIRPLGLDGAEVKGLAAFLRSRNGDNVKELVADAFAAPIGDTSDNLDGLTK